MAKIDISVKILRYQPGKDEKPHWQTFDISVEDESTILDVLNEIHWQHDGTLAYRRSCRSSICGSCAMKVNGRNVLACETPIHRFGSKLKIEPLSGFDIIKDLAVDLEPFFAKLQRIKPYLILDKPTPDKEFVQSPAQLEADRRIDAVHPLRRLQRRLPELVAQQRVPGPGRPAQGLPLRLRQPRRRRRPAPGDRQRQERRLALPHHLQLHGGLPQEDQDHRVPVAPEGEGGGELIVEDG